MERRSFLKALLGVPFLGLLPWVKERLAWKANFGTAVLNENWYCIVHPDTWSAFVSVTRRGQWKDAHRAYRQSGEHDLTAKQIWEKFGKTLDAPTLDAPLTGEVGKYENVRFIVSSSV